MYGVNIKLAKIIIDTDIGTNPDDALAIALAVNSPEINIKGITIVYGDVETRGKIAKEITLLANKDIDIYLGIEKPLLRQRKVFWSGIEGKEVNINKEINFKKMHAVNYIIKTIMNNPGEITLVTIGPLTNIAASIILEPKIIENIKEIIMMAGAVHLASNKNTLEKYEHNISSDPEAASIVFNSGIKITMVGLDVTRQVSLTKSEKNYMFNKNIPLVNLISQMLDNHMNYLKRDYFYLSDSIAMSLLIDSKIVRTEKMEVTINYDGKIKSGKTNAKKTELGNVDVALEIDKTRFFDLLKTRVFNK